MSDLRIKALTAEIEAARLALEYAQGIDDRHAMVRAMVRIRMAKQAIADSAPISPTPPTASPPPKPPSRPYRLKSGLAKPNARP
jgi:hypothetical protein